MIELADWQQRVVDEHKDLQPKIIALNNFFFTETFKNLNIEDQNLLQQQLDGMTDYFNALTKRVQRFTGVKRYKCHKQVMARPMTRGNYHTLQGTIIPADENPDDPGYLVEYLDGGKPNHPSFEHYISWSPKDTFEAGYKELP